MRSRPNYILDVPRCKMFTDSRQAGTKERIDLVMLVARELTAYETNSVLAAEAAESIIDLVLREYPKLESPEKAKVDGER